jgi:hypothetical protein
VYSATNASERAKRIIYLFNREFGVKQPDGSFYFPKWIKHYEIANSAATTREKVSQTISQLRQQGLVESRGHLLILKPALFRTVKSGCKFRTTTNCLNEILKIGFNQKQWFESCCFFCYN